MYFYYERGYTMKRRRIITVLLAVIMLFAFSACDRNGENEQNQNNNNIPENSQNTENADNTENNQNTENTVIAPKELHPDGVSRLEGAEICFVTQNTALPQTLPVYVDEYAVGQTGPMYQITDKLLEELHDNLHDFLEELYGDKTFDITGSRENSVPEARYEQDGRRFVATPDSISVFTTGINLYRDITSENICDNEIVRAAMEYLDIDTPQIKMTVTNNLSGEVDTTVYTISESTDSFSEHIRNTSFEYITVQHIAGVSEATLTVFDVDDLRVHEQVETMTVSRALEAVSQGFPKMNKSRVKAELFYTKDAKSGYYTPCYRLYIEKKIDGYERLYDIINVPFAYAHPFYTALDVTPKE